MADEITIESNALDLLRLFQRLPEDLQKRIRKGLKRGLLLLEGDVKRRADLQFRGASAGMVSRLTSFVDDTGLALGLDGVIGFRKTAHFPYEMSQEFGAQAKPGGAMAMPVSDEARELSDRGVSAKDFPRKLFSPNAKTSGGNGYLAEALPKGGLIVHYIFLKSLQPRLHFRETVFHNVERVEREVTEAVNA